MHHAMDLANTFLQFSVRVGAGGRAALELGPVGAPVAEIMLDASGVAVRSRGGEPAAIAEVRTEGKADLWRNVLVEFLPGEIGVAVDGLPFLRASMAAVPVRRHEGFALTRHAG
ncbi:MAG: hypothetical protein ACKOTE_11250, partial [Opitutaceae bacterium]